MANRKTELLLAAADALDEGIDPFGATWLSEHEVALDECYDLSDNLALGARMLANAVEELQGGGLPATVAAQRIFDSIALKNDKA
jgi:hypothetical protein